MTNKGRTIYDLFTARIENIVSMTVRGRLLHFSACLLAGRTCLERLPTLQSSRESFQIEHAIEKEVPKSVGEKSAHRPNHGGLLAAPKP